MDNVVFSRCKSCEITSHTCNVVIPARMTYMLDCIAESPHVSLIGCTRSFQTFSRVSPTFPSLSLSFLLGAQTEEFAGRYLLVVYT